MSYAVFSDELCQDKVNAYAFNSANLEKVKEVTSVKTVLYGSDGAGSQLKNRYNLASLLYHRKTSTARPHGTSLKLFMARVQ